MSREIKFRGQSKSDPSRWIYGMPSHDFKYIFSSDQLDSPDNYEVIPETVTQFIGLKDSAGNEIYEGDIVLANGSESVLVHDFSNARKFASVSIRDVRKFEPRRSIYKVYWMHNFSQFGFESLSNPKHSIDSNINEREYEVIGNIYEHPHLIK